MKKGYLLTLSVSLNVLVCSGQTLSPASIGAGTGIFTKQSNLSYGVNNISLVSIKPMTDSTNMQIYDVFDRDDKSSWLEVYPNPATDNLWLGFQLPANEASTAYMFDNSGKKIAEIKLGTSDSEIITHQLDISKLPAGIYLLNLVYSPARGGMPQTLATKFQVLH